MRKLVTILPVIVLFASCYSPRYVYSPVTQNVPLLSKKNDVTASAFFAINSGGSNVISNKHGYSLGSDVHLAYAVTHHFAVMLNQYNRWEKNTTANDFFAGDSLQIKYKRDLTELGGGYFSASKNNNNYFQIFGGMAYGKFHINERSLQTGNSLSKFHTSRITKIFLQPAIVAGQQKKFTAAFSMRFSAVFYSNIQTDYTPAELDDYFLSSLPESPVFFWEPAMSYTFSFKKPACLKFQVQTGISILLNHRFVDYRSLNLGLGILANLPSKKIKKVKDVKG